MTKTTLITTTRPTLVTMIMTTRPTLWQKAFDLHVFDWFLALSLIRHAYVKPTNEHGDRCALASCHVSISVTITWCLWPTMRLNTVMPFVQNCSLFYSADGLWVTVKVFSPRGIRPFSQLKWVGLGVRDRAKSIDTYRRYDVPFEVLSQKLLVRFVSCHWPKRWPTYLIG